MVWKRKEKPLSPEEAIRLARVEQAPFWFNSTPLLMGSRTQTGVRLWPLEDSFKELSWIFAIIDVMDLHGIHLLEHLVTWHERYSPLGISGLGILRSPYQFGSADFNMQGLTRAVGIKFPAVYDSTLMLSANFIKKKAENKLVFCKKGKPLFEESESARLPAFEKEIQRHLRSEDPGLPLLEPFLIQSPLLHETGRIDLGGGGAKKIELAGKWESDANHISTLDPQARLTFKMLGPGFSMVGHALSKDSPLIDGYIEQDGNPIPQTCFLQDMISDDLARTFIRFQQPKLYRAVDQLEEGSTVSIRFPAAERGGVGLYGFRFHSKAAPSA